MCVRLRAIAGFDTCSHIGHRGVCVLYGNRKISLMGFVRSVQICTSLSPSSLCHRFAFRSAHALSSTDISCDTRESKPNAQPSIASFAARENRPRGAPGRKPCTNSSRRPETQARSVAGSTCRRNGREQRRAREWYAGIGCAKVSSLSTPSFSSAGQRPRGLAARDAVVLPPRRSRELLHPSAARRHTFAVAAAGVSRAADHETVAAPLIREPRTGRAGLDLLAPDDVPVAQNLAAAVYQRPPAIGHSLWVAAGTDASFDVGFHAFSDCAFHAVTTLFPTNFRPAACSAALASAFVAKKR